MNVADIKYYYLAMDDRFKLQSTKKKNSDLKRAQFSKKSSDINTVSVNLYVNLKMNKSVVISNIFFFSFLFDKREVTSCVSLNNILFFPHRLT